MEKRYGRFAKLMKNIETIIEEIFESVIVPLPHRKIYVNRDFMSNSSYIRISWIPGNNPPMDLSTLHYITVSINHNAEREDIIHIAQDTNQELYKYTKGIEFDKDIKDLLS